MKKIDGDGILTVYCNIIKGKSLKKIVYTFQYLYLFSVKLTICFLKAAKIQEQYNYNN